MNTQAIVSCGYLEGETQPQGDLALANNCLCLTSERGLVTLQAGHLLGLPGFPKGLIGIVRGHQDRELAQEAAWLLAFITAGPEAHMHAMVKQGAARAVASALSCRSPRVQGGQVPVLNHCL